MKIKEIVENSNFEIQSGQMSAMGSNRPNPANERRKRAKAEAEKIASEVRKR